MKAPVGPTLAPFNSLIKAVPALFNWKAVFAISFALFLISLSSGISPWVIIGLPASSNETLKPDPLLRVAAWIYFALSSGV